MVKLDIRVGDGVRIMLWDATMIDGVVKEIEDDIMLVEEASWDESYTSIEMAKIAVMFRNKRTGESMEDGLKVVAVI